MAVAPGAVWLISGCSSGFGKLLAETALERGFKVIATARKVSTLDGLKAKGAAVLTLDVSRPASEIADFAKEALAIYGRLDVLVSNAGVCQGGAVEEVSPEEALAQFQTNFFGTVNLTNAFLPSFRKQGTGTIVNISSMAGVLNNPGAGIYCASKAAIDSISDSYRRELAPFGIRVVSIQPGAFATPVGSHIAVAAPLIEGYDSAHAWTKMLNTGSGQEPGDPQKGVERIIDLVMQDPLPMRFALGDDSHTMVMKSLQYILDDYKKWESLSTGTNRDDWVAPDEVPEWLLDLHRVQVKNNAH